MTFLEYIEDRIKDGEEFDAIIGGVDMSATFGFCDDWKITDYCKEKFGDLLNSEVIKIYSGNEICRFTDCVEVDYDDDRVGEQFCMSVAGYIEETEWNKLFKGGNDE